MICGYVPFDERWLGPILMVVDIQEYLAGVGKRIMSQNSFVKGVSLLIFDLRYERRKKIGS